MYPQPSADTRTFVTSPSPVPLSCTIRSPITPSVNTVAGSNTFTSGFAGGGWRIDEGVSASGTSATFDNLTIRGTMSVYELLINQIRATNGNLFVSAVGKVSSSVTSSITNYFSMS